MPQNWNIPGVGGDLPQIANMLYQRQQDQQRNALAQLAQEQERAIREQQMAQQAAQFQQQGQWRLEDRAREDEMTARQRADAVKARRQEARARAEENERDRIARARENALGRASDERIAALRASPAVGAPAVNTNPFNLNDRQQAGVRAEMDALINYAASYTSRKPEDVREILRTQGPDAVAQLVRDNPRVTDGRAARFATELPFVGALARPIFNTIHADLMQPLGQGGAGIAAQQNPSGMITNADVDIGKTQFPGYNYPVDVQANIIAQRLKYAMQSMGAQPASAPPASMQPAGDNDPLGIR